LQTSNFSRAGRDPSIKCVSIALYAPRGYPKVRRYPALAPTRQMLKMGEAEYRAAYQEILDRLDPRKVYQELGEDAVLLCWEKPGEFCHRRLVAEWLEKHLGVEIPEYVAPGKQKNLFK
jgi:hypothetical protein